MTDKLTAFDNLQDKIVREQRMTNQLLYKIFDKLCDINKELREMKK